VIADVDRVVVRTTLKACGGNSSLAAERLGLARMTLRRKLRSLTTSLNGNPIAEVKPPVL
jgi:DNA-binding protein Fis